MSDLYQRLTNSPIGKQLASTVGAPVPPVLRRYDPGAPLVTGPALVGAADGSGLTGTVTSVLTDAGVDVLAETPEGTKVGAAIFDATGISNTSQLVQLPTFFRTAVRQLGPCARVVVIGSPPSGSGDPHRATAQRALEGFVRSVAKELRDGATAQLIEVGDDGEEGLAAPLRFVLSGRSAYVSGQVIRVGAPITEVEEGDPRQPLVGKVALVTGAARGIGEAIAQVLARDGAHVICLDIPPAGAALTGVANSIGGSTLQLDITAENAPEQVASHVRERHDGIDVIVHNAGITRDKLLANMDADLWSSVIDVNLASQERIDDLLLGDKLIRSGGRLIGVASISGIAGNRGQTNYATSKAGVIGRVTAMAPLLADAGITINAVAPGFIETEMTGKMPIGVREAGRRMNSLSQGGQPIDVAEAIAFFADPAASGVTGNVLRVCGQSLLGA